MKKLFIVLAVASLGFVACNNEAETKPEGEDSASKMEQTTPPATNDSMPPKDSMPKVDSPAAQ